MATSLFSSFDALLAETFGQKVSFAWAPRFSKQQGSASSSSSGEKGSSSSYPKNPPQEKQQQQQKMKRTPRFAVEFDGLHCFETIVPN